MSEPRLWTRSWFLAVVGLVVGLTVVVARVALDARGSLRAGIAAEERGDRPAAVRHYLDAARAYLPGGAAGDAVARLDAIAAAAEDEQRLLDARRALEAARAGLLGTRSFYTPDADRLADIDARLASLYARTEDPGVDPGATIEARTAWHAGRLAQRPGPAVGHVVLALGGLALWLGAVVAFVRRGLDGGLRLRRGPAVAAGLLFALGFALFVTGLRLA